MSEQTTTTEAEVLDVRGLRKPDKHPAIFAAYAALRAGEAFILVNDHDPQHLHDEFEADHAGSYGWDYENREMRDWRIRITKLASTPLPRVLLDTTTITGDDTTETDTLGAAWRLQARDRDLDSTVIALSAGAGVDTHTGPDLDTLVHILGGSGTLTTELGTIDLAPGQLVWLPRRSQRAFTAGPGGLRYLTVHQRRQGLVLSQRP